jgi:hypothetical protein
VEVAPDLPAVLALTVASILPYSVTCAEAAPTTARAAIAAKGYSRAKVVCSKANTVQRIIFIGAGIREVMPLLDGYILLDWPLQQHSWAAKYFIFLAERGVYFENPEKNQMISANFKN